MLKALWYVAVGATATTVLMLLALDALDRVEYRECGYRYCAGGEK